MKKIIMASLTAMVLIAACKKDENTTTGSLELTKANIAGKYLTTGATFTPTGSVAIDFFNTTSFPACEKDNFHIFDATNNYSYADSGTKCTPSSTFTGTYSITPPNQLTFKGKTYLVESFTTTNLVFAFDSTAVIPPSTTITGRVKLTLTKQP